MEHGREDCKVTKEDKRKFLRRLVVTDEEILRIANYEQRSPEWHEARKYRLTGSNFGAAADHYKDKQKTPAILLSDMLWPGKFKGNAATQYGTDREPFIHQVVETYMNTTGKTSNTQEVVLEECGLIVCKEHPWLGVSPDDFILIYDSATKKMNVGLAEYKAPYQKKQFYPVCPHYYYDQFQGQMAVARSFLKLRYPHIELEEESGTWTKFCVWTPHATQVNHYRLDEAYWADLFKKLKKFYIDTVVPRFILKERGVLQEGEVDVKQIVNIDLKPLDINSFVF